MQLDTRIPLAATGGQNILNLMNQQHSEQRADDRFNVQQEAARQAEERQKRQWEAEQAYKERDYNDKRQSQFDKIADDNATKTLFGLDYALKNNPNMVGEILGRRKQLTDKLIENGWQPENGMTETDGLIQAYQTGDLESIKNFTNAGMHYLKQTGAVNTPETFETITDAQGNPIAQRSSTSGKLISDPRAPKAPLVQIGPDGYAPDTPDLPQPILNTLPEEQRPVVNATYKAAGGGEAGIKAVKDTKKTFDEAARRKQSSQLLARRFPNATAPEMSQLQAAVDSAETVEKGIERASKIREEQIRLVKAAEFQDNAIQLLENIVNSDQLGDVTGPIEGRYDTRLFSEAESNLIADIKEAGDILLSDNLKLMTGVLSETDIQVLKNLAAGGLDRVRGEEKVRSRAEQMLKRLRSVRAHDVIRNRYSQPKTDEDYNTEFDQRLEQARQLIKQGQSQ